MITTFLGWHHSFHKGKPLIGKEGTLYPSARGSMRILFCSTKLQFSTDASGRGFNVHQSIRHTVGRVNPVPSVIGRAFIQDRSNNAKDTAFVIESG